ncbi:inosine 5'-monophosphate dehydrogenase [Stieleria maiorica]|uniref:Inosine 5'-monophosphate dehydrogenase n=1 Tax=Stieleria maiorica TaxID=2795974 RepID=A0A5B9MPW6_9BACT|nr:CBS domain-containing protein [Stieleria maiorica]QEG01805.1 inosine 5'-monophosphate dehydrogenase [Stieleria maiorica]
MSSFFRLDPAESIDPLSNFEPADYDSELERALAEDAVAEIDAKPYLQISPYATVQEAVEMLHDSGAASLLVVDSDRLVGIFTERDVLEKVVERYPRICSRPVEEFMTRDPTIVYQSDPSAAAAAAIAVAGHRHVPVLDMDERIQGIISPRRMFAFMERHFS